jgi:hypothetical protein
MELGHSIRAGTPTFEHVHGMQVFDYFNRHLDIQMLVHLRGKERTQAEWKELLHVAGFQITRVVSTSSFAHVVEAVRSKSD